MAINKLLKPTFDSQKAINDLGLTVQVLSPAGESAKNSLKNVTGQLDRTKKQTSALSDEIRMLNGQLTDLSIEQQSNTLAIEQIRARAARQNRELTDQEISQIDRLTQANESLRLNEMSLDLERAKSQRSLTILTEKQKELDAESKTLMKTVEQRATKLTSIGDVLLVGFIKTTTTQVLEMFGAWWNNNRLFVVTANAFHGRECNKVQPPIARHSGTGRCSWFNKGIVFPIRLGF